MVFQEPVSAGAGSAMTGGRPWETRVSFFLLSLQSLRKGKTMNILRLPGKTMFAAAALSSSVALHAQVDYANEFDTSGFDYYNVTDGWTHDMDAGELHLSIGGGTRNRFGTVALPEWVGEDFIASSWFSVEETRGTGNNPVSVGVVALSNEASPGNYYLAHWGVAGGGAGTMGQLIVLRTGGGNFSVESEAIGHPEPGMVYELRLTGEYDELGALKLTAGIYDRNGNLVGPTASAVDPIPLTGQYFGIRDRTAGGDHLLNITHYGYSVSHDLLPPPTLPLPILIEFTAINPAPGAISYPAEEGLRVTVTTGADRMILPEDIELYLDDERIPHEDLVITGEATAREVFFGGLEANRMYSARIVARDNLHQREFSWNFDTIVITSPISTLTDVPLNQATDDDIQRLAADSDYTELLPERETVFVLTDATSAETPAAGVVLSEDVPVTVTWDLAGSPVRAAHRALKQVDIWIAGSDPFRTGFDGEFATSRDGVNFTLVPESRYAAALPYTGADTVIGGNVVEGTGTGNVNLVRYLFDPEDFSEGIRYLRFISYGYNNLGELDNNQVRQPRIIEIDASVERSGPYITDISPAEGASFHKPESGIRFSVSADAGKMIAAENISLVVNGSGIPANELTISEEGSSLEIVYGDLVSNENYSVQVSVSDGERETAYQWTFDTRETIYGQYTNDFDVEPLPFRASQAGRWQLRAEDGVFNYLQPTRAGGSVGTASVELGGWEGVDFAVSTKFTVRHVGGSGTPTAGFGVLGTQSTFQMYYLADWGMAPNGTQGIRILAQPTRSSFSSVSGDPGRPVPGQTYEMRLTGIYQGGVLHMTLVVLDEDGNQLGTAATATDTEPLTGRFFGYRNRTNGSEHTMDLDFHYFRVTPPPPQVTGPNPLPDATFQSAENGLRFTVFASDGEAIPHDGIQVFIDDEEVPAAELTITGTATAPDVFYNGLEANRFYTVRVVVAGTNGVETVRTWSFDTFSEDTTIVIEAEDYNFAADVGCDASGNPIGTLLTGGSYIDDPLPSTFYSPWQALINQDQDGIAVGYVDRVGVPGVDFHDADTQTGIVGVNMFRFCDPVGTVETFDHVRPKYIDASDTAGALIPDYHVNQVQTGEWLNYTRNFPEGSYRVFLRAAATGTPAAVLERVVSDPSLPGQMTEAIGEFVLSPAPAFSYVPLTNASGEPVILSLAGEETLRLVATSANNNIDFNFLLFVPAEEVPELPQLSLVRDGDQVFVVWEGANVQLESATEVTGPWVVIEGATSPHPVDTVLQARQFFRLRGN